MINSSSFKVKACALPILLFINSTAFAQHQPNQNKFSEGRDQYGLGFGLVSSGSSGESLYGDFNLPSINKQAHLQYESSGQERASIIGLNKVTLKQNALHGSFRHVYDSGWYYGLVAGWYNSTLRMDQIGSNGNQKDQSIYFYERGIIVGPEFGWQGNDFYYFTIGLRGLGRNKVASHYDLNEVYNISNHRETVEELWNDGKIYSAIYIGFAWYLQSDKGNLKETNINDQPAKSIDSQTLEKAKKCQSKGGVWVNDMCRLEVE